MRAWYERRIEEETMKNRKLKELHDNLLRVRDLQRKQAEMQSQEQEQK